MRPIPGSKIGYYFLNQDGTLYESEAGWAGLLQQDQLIDHIGPYLFENLPTGLVRIRTWNLENIRIFSQACVERAPYYYDLKDFSRSELLTLAIGYAKKARDNMIETPLTSKQRLAYSQQARYSAMSMVAYAVASLDRIKHQTRNTSSVRLIVKNAQSARGLVLSSEVEDSEAGKHDPDIAKEIGSKDKQGREQEHTWQSVYLSKLLWP